MKTPRRKLNHKENVFHILAPAVVHRSRALYVPGTNYPVVNHQLTRRFTLKLHLRDGFSFQVVFAVSSAVQLFEL